MKLSGADLKLYDLIVWGIIIIFAAVFTALALNRHAAFETNGFDLGNVNQAIWNTAHGRPLAFSNMAPLTNRLALHVEPILFLFVPFYWLGLGGPKLLLAAQAMAVALGAWPLYLIARPKIGPAGAVIVSVAYLLYPALEAAVIFDFHTVTLAPTFLLFAFYYLEQALGFTSPQSPDRGELEGGKWLPFTIFALLTLACKEDMGLIVAMLGLYVGLAHKRWKPAAFIFALGMLWSLAAILLIQPIFAVGGNIQGNRYIWLAGALTNPSLLWTHLRQVNLPDYLWQLFAPVAGLSLLSPLALLPILPSLAINLLSNHPLTWRLEEFHYAAPMTPFIFIAVILSVQRMGEWSGGAGERRSRGDKETRRQGEEEQGRQGDKETRRQGDKETRRGGAGETRRQGGKLFTIHYSLFIILLLSSLFYHYFRGFTPLARPFHWRPASAHQQLGAEMAAQIDPALPLFAPLNLNPHVSSRQVLHQDFDDITPDDWLWLDVASLPNENNIQQYIRDDLLPQYEIVRADDGYLLLKPQSLNTASFTVDNSEFFSFTRPTAPPQYPLSVIFGESLELTGYNLRFNRAEEVQVVTYWRALAPLPAELAPVLFLADEGGNLKGETQARTLSSTMIWFPADQWPVGETIVVTFNKFTWETRSRAVYRLGIGISTAEDPWDAGARWQPAVQQSSFANRLLSERTILELAVIERIAGFPEGEPRSRRFDAAKMQKAPHTNFGGQIELAGTNRPRVDDDALSIDLLWRGVGSARGDYVRFVHVVGADGQLWGQWDSPPVNGQYPTSLWQDGEFVAETVELALKPDSPSGLYTLHVGLYDPISGQRLTDELGQDHVQISLQVNE